MITDFKASSTVVMQIAHACPLCSSTVISDYHDDKKRRYFQCSRCQLVFVDPLTLPTAAQERQEYELHQNTFEDDGYRRFLSRLADPLLDVLSPCSAGLDFGCGPTPLLAKILGDAGHEVEVFDPLFFNHPHLLRGSYDFITSSEAVEHFHYPAKEFQLWNNLLTTGGWLAIMTKRVISQDRFTHWHYKNDPTHVSFFSEETFNFLAAQYQYDVQIISSDVVLMQKRG